MIRESNLSSAAMPQYVSGARAEPDASGWRLRPGLLLLVVLMLSLVTSVSVGYLHFGERVRAYQLMDDPASYAQVEWYTGVLSNVVVLLWCAAAAICGFAGFLLRASDDTRLRASRRFLLLLAVSSLWLTFDDLLLLHEQLARHLVGREYQHHGEGVVFALYGFVMASCFWRFRATIARTEYALLIGAVVSLLASAAIDVSFQLEMNGNNLFRETILSIWWGASFIDITEEMLKLNGALLWFAYLVRTSLSGVREVISEHASDSAARGTAAN